MVKQWKPVPWLRKEINGGIKPGIVSGTGGIPGMDNLQEEAGSQLIKVCR